MRTSSAPSSAIATPSGAGPNPLAVGFLKEMAGVDVTFLGWMAYGLPASPGAVSYCS